MKFSFQHFIQSRNLTVENWMCFASMNNFQLEKVSQTDNLRDNARKKIEKQNICLPIHIFHVIHTFFSSFSLTKSKLKLEKLNSFLTDNLQHTRSSRCWECWRFRRHFAWNISIEIEVHASQCYMGRVWHRQLLNNRKIKKIQLNATTTKVFPFFILFLLLFSISIVGVFIHVPE
jgi:hypothetical protein